MQNSEEECYVKKLIVAYGPIKRLITDQKMTRIYMNNGAISSSGKPIKKN